MRNRTKETSLYGSKLVRSAVIAAMWSLIACTTAEEEKVGGLTGDLVLNGDENWPHGPWQLLVEAQSKDGFTASATLTMDETTGRIQFSIDGIPVGAADIEVFLQDPDARPGTLGHRIIVTEIENVTIIQGETVLPDVAISVGDVIDVSYFELQTTLFEPACISCHYRGSGSQPELDAESSHANLVNVPSIGKPDRLLVDPGDADNSYLIDVLSEGGTHHGRVSDGQLALIVNWIGEGAQEVN